MQEASQAQPCIYTVTTGKHEWYTLSSTGSKCGIGYDFCPECNYVDIYALIKKASLWKLLKIKLFNHEQN